MTVSLSQRQPTTSTEEVLPQEVLGATASRETISCSGGTAVIIATREREKLLVERSLPSVALQTRPPCMTVVVADRVPLGPECVSAAQRLFTSTPLIILNNCRTPGAAGAWNTALDWIEQSGFGGNIALLDDDDTWDPCHLEVNEDAVKETGANLCVSGLRMVRAEGMIERPLLERLEVEDFLVGNPGWQGSNTFMSARLMRDVGRFDERLDSLLDRDLAIRVICEKSTQCVLVPRWTATWYLGTPGSLSMPRGEAKLRGLAAFLLVHGSKMTDLVRRRFFERAELLFGFRADEILKESAKCQ